MLTWWIELIKIKQVLEYEFSSTPQLLLQSESLMSILLPGELHLDCQARGASPGNMLAESRETKKKFDACCQYLFKLQLYLDRRLHQPSLNNHASARIPKESNNSFT